MSLLPNAPKDYDQNEEARNRAAIGLVLASKAPSLGNLQIALTNNTTVTLTARGTDGHIRTATITLA